MEGGAGAGSIYGSGGLAAPIGWAMLVHGVDEFAAGMYTLVTGEEAVSSTEALLVNSGLTPETAIMVNDGISTLLSGGRAKVGKVAVGFVGKGKNIARTVGRKVHHHRFRPDPMAKGAHSRFRRNAFSGKTEKYETYVPQTNSRNPNPWESMKRYDSKQHPHTHFNKELDMKIETPHVHDKTAPGGIRKPELWEVPKWQR